MKKREENPSKIETKEETPTDKKEEKPAAKDEKKDAKPADKKKDDKKPVDKKPSDKQVDKKKDDTADKEERRRKLDAILAYGDAENEEDKSIAMKNETLTGACKSQYTLDFKMKADQNFANYMLPVSFYKKSIFSVFNKSNAFL